jgi:4-carboxymuconolactone decarboxylase
MTKPVNDIPASDESDYDKGMRTRRAVLGDKWVDRSLNRRTEFNAEFQELITRYAWNEIWNRPGLNRQMRRVMVLSVTMSMGRWEEFELHIRAALQATDGTGLTAEEIKEVLLQNAIYAGVPASNTAFNLAQVILNELAASDSGSDPATN